MSRRTAATVFFLVVSTSLFAQSQVVIAFVGVYSQGVNNKSLSNGQSNALTSDEIRVLENRITSYLVQVADAENYGLIIPNDREQILAEIAPNLNAGDTTPEGVSLSTQVAARALVAGIAKRSGGRYSLGLNLIRVDTGKTVNRVSGDYSAYNDLIAGCKGLVFALFQVMSRPESRSPSIASESPDSRSGGASGPSPLDLRSSESFVDKPNLRMVRGTWQGDKGIETVRIASDGSAMAEIGDGSSMKLSVTIEGDQIIVRQDEPNSPKLYLPFGFPYSVAVQIVQLARPMSWVFRLTTNHNVLKGTKETSYFRIDRGTVVYVDNTYTRAAEWRRLK